MANGIIRIDPPNKEHLIDILIKTSVVASGSIGMQGYFRLLINRTNWSDRFKRSRIGGLCGDPDVDSRSLVDWAIATGTIRMIGATLFSATS